MPTVELGLFVFGGDVDLEPNALLFDFGPLWSFLEMYVGIEAHKTGPFSVSHTKKASAFSFDFPSSYSTWSTSSR